VDTVQFLRSMDIFRPLPDEELARIATRLRERRFREGQPIFHKGEPGESMYLVLDGRVKILSPDASGQERVLAFLEEGAFFGEMALLTGGARSTDVQAASEVTLLELRRVDFEERVASHPLVLKQMLRLLAERQGETNLRLLQRDEEAEGRGTGRGKVFTVYSTKGGAGKSTLAVNLAVTLAQQYPEQVALLDLSLTFGHAPMLLDLQPRASLSAMSVEVLGKFDREALSNYMATHASTLRVLPGAVRPEEGEGVSQEHVQTVLGLLKRFFGYVVVDTSSTFTDTTLAALENSDKVVFLVTPELTSVRDLVECQRIFTDVVRVPADRFYYLLNHPYGFKALSRADFEQAFGRPVTGELPHGGDTPVQAAARGQAFTASQPTTAIARAVDNLARELTGAPVRSRQPSDGASAGAGRRGGPFAFLFGRR
jgi:Flp pilus assembly CpaE family ATPase